jgi:TonB family protein
VKRPLRVSSAIVIFVLFTVGCPTSRGSEGAREKDIASARAAFATLVQYGNAHDTRFLDLFSRNCSITIIIRGATTTKAVALPFDAFRKFVREGMALKRGGRDIYERVKYSQNGPKVSVTANFHSSNLDERGSLFAVYGRDDKGILKIQELKVTVYAPYNYTGAELKAMFIKTVEPEYPTQAFALRHTGDGTFRLAIGENGRVTSVATVQSTGYRELDKSCLAALGQWQAKAGPKRVVDVPVTFTMGAGSSSSSATWNIPPPTSNRLGPVMP